MDEEEEEDYASVGATPNISKSNTPVPHLGPTDDAESDTSTTTTPKRKLGPNTSVGNAPKVLTRSSLLKEAQTREQLRKEFVVLQEVVKATEIVIPYVFFDGTNIPGGRVRVKKGDHVWLFLDKARKVGAEMGVGSEGGKRGWARISVDDLMLVRGDIIIPPVSFFFRFCCPMFFGNKN
jgi:protein FAM50